METMNTCTANEMKTPAVVTIRFDWDFAEHLKEEYGEEFIAFKNDSFGIGVYFTESGTFGVYGDDDFREMAISSYWDENEEDITQAIADAETIDDVISAFHAVILGCIADIMAA